MGNVRSIIYGIFGLIITVITIRLLLLFLGLNQFNPFVSFWLEFSNFFVFPWHGIAPDIKLFGNSYIELTSIVAMFFYMIIGLLIEKSADSFGETTKRSMLVSIVDSMFKIVEFLLATRIFLKLFGVGSQSVFADFIYSITQWIITPFGRLVSDYQFGPIVVELSTILVLVIIVILDIGIDEFFRAIFKKSAQTKSK
jgi:hypothetical protein